MTTLSRTRALAREQIDRQLESLRGEPARPLRGWIRAIRESLGMTTAQFARRLGVSQPAVSQLEKAEATDAVTLARLRAAAEALDCTLVYALVPRDSLQGRVEARAHQLAEAQTAYVAHSMRLEAQETDSRALERERKRAVDDLLRGDPARLWDEM